DDNLGAIQFYTYGLRQIDEQQEKELASKGKSSIDQNDNNNNNNNDDDDYIYYDN
ncbi:unnamed protein product, partial [Rotaria sp. Silwood2]